MDFDFDAWTKMSRENPAEFERQREAILRRAIESAPAEHRQRLEGLQFQIDMERRRAGSALGACIKLQSMMWACFFRLKKELDALANGATPAAQPGKVGAEVISMQQFVQAHRTGSSGENQA